MDSAGGWLSDAGLHRQILKAASAAGIAAPSRYYALLVLDGDRMGQWLSGEKGAGAFDGATGAARQQAISRRLATFASRRVPDVVETGAAGRLIYGGGDDVVALLSFETALPAARAVYDAFQETFHDEATASAGLVLAHHLTPLQQVLAAARAAEKRAKDAGRDRLTITALKRSGDPSEVTLPWSALGSLSDFADLVRAGGVARGASYDVAEALRLFAGPDTTDAATGQTTPASVPADLAEPFRAEARRLFGRRMERTAEADRAATYDATAGALLAVLAPAAAVEALQVGQFLGRGGDR